MSKFVHFGCWNKGGCTQNGQNPLSKVMNLLNEYCEEENPNFIIVAGDNYYPAKKKDANGKKQKTISTQDLASGFDCLPNDIPVDIILGNHDLETNEPGSETIKVNDGTNTSVESNCRILQEELKLVSSGKGRKSLVLNKTRMMNAHTLICMFDTTIFSIDYEESIPCYKQLEPSNANQHEYLFRLIHRQLNSIRDAILKNRQIKNIIFIGHNPITTLKTSDDNETVQKMPSAYLAYFLQSVRNFVDNPNVKYYYLCAHVHSYHEATVYVGDMKLKQYIVGIGGADLDPAPLKNFMHGKTQITVPVENLIGTDGSEIDIVYKPNMNKWYEQVNGFLVVKDELNNGELTFELKTTDAMRKGGENKKSRKNRKTKTRDLKRRNKTSRTVGAVGAVKTVGKTKSHLVRVFMEMLNMIKLYHWKTYSYSEHKATDELYSKMQENIDKFVEVLMGKDNSRIRMLENKIDLVDTSSKVEFKQRILKYRKFLTEMNMYFDDEHDSDLLNIRDELLADLNQFLYLFSMHK